MATSHLELLKDLTLGITSTSDWRAALTVSADVLCAHFSWPAGVVWTCDDDQRLTATYVGGEDDRSSALQQALSELEAMPADRSRHGVLAALVSGHTTSATWAIAGGGDDEVSEVLKRLGYGVTTAHAVLAGGRCVAILQLFIDETCRPDQDLLAIIETVGAQLGHLIDRERARDDARQRALLTERILDGSADAFISLDPQGRISDWNRSAEELFGFTADEATGQRLEETIAGADAVRDHGQEIAELALTGRSELQRQPFETTLRRRNGSTFTAEVVLWLTEVDDRRMISGFIRDVSEVRAHQRELANSREQLAQAQQVAQMGSWDLEGRTGELRWSDQYRANLGVGPDAEPTVDLLLDVTHPDDRVALRSSLAHADRNAGPFTLEFRVVHPDGDLRRMRATGMTELDEDGALIRSWGAVLDVTEEHRLRDAIRHRNRHDPLTDLVNRPTFLEHVEAAIGTEYDGSTDQVLVALLDLDRFSAINDQVGPSGGDQVIVALADRLRARFDLPGTFTARTGGDEFGLLVVGGPERPEEIGEQLAELLRMPIRVAGHEVTATASIGLAVHDPRTPDGEHDADAILRNADFALDTAKARGGDVAQVFEARMHAETLAQLALQADLTRAIEEHEIVAHYQPVVEVSTGDMLGFEALARWPRQGHGLVAPDVFLPLAEEHGLVVALGRDILRQACADLADFRRMAPHHADLTMAVNVSVHQLAEPDLLNDVRAALADAGLPPEALVLEVTESALGSPDIDTVAPLNDLEALGIRLAIDDFGTGYSSLSRLRDYPFHLLKIDRSFLRDVTGPDDEPVILTALFSLAAKLGLRVIVEGVETAAHLAVVLRQGADEAQGYLFGRALPADDVRRMLADPSWDQTSDREDTDADELLPDIEHHQLAAALRRLVHLPTTEAFTAVLEALAAVAGLAGAHLVRGVAPHGETVIALEQPRYGAVRREDVSVPIYGPDGDLFGRLGADYADPATDGSGAQALLELVSNVVSPVIYDLA